MRLAGRISLAVAILVCTPLRAADKPKSLVGLWEVKSATINGEDMATAKITAPYLRKDSIWRFEEDGTGKYGVTEMTWTYDPSKLQPLVISEEDVFGKANPIVKASVKYVDGKDDIRLKYEIVGFTYIVVLSPED